jgi:methylglutaconyl-CoA hydratase
MDYKTLKTETTGDVLNCWLNRPEKRNAINTQMLSDLIGLSRYVEISGKIRVFVLRGEGGVFSAGADLAMMSDTAGKTDAELRREAKLFFDCFEAIEKLPVPSICHTHGGVHGGANGLAAACDFSLTDPGTRFSFAEVRLGLVPATVAPFIVARTGMVKAKQMMLGAMVFDGKEAVEIGLADMLCSTAEADDRIENLCITILQNGPEALRKTKSLLSELGQDPDRSSLRKTCIDLIAETRRSDEALEGISAFFNKRKPAWNGDQ